MSSKRFIAKPGRGAPVISLGKLAAARAVTDDMLAEINALPMVLEPHAAGDVIVRGFQFMNDKPMHESPWFVRRFDAAAVASAQSFVRGRPVLCNHDTIAAQALPVARVFRPDGVERDEAGVTWGNALFFMLSDPEGQSFDRRIRGGVLGEVSPTVLYDRLYCSICGVDELECEHVPGKAYEGNQKCYAVMSDISDVLEVSLVWAGMQKDTGFYLAANRELGELTDTERFLKDRVPDTRHEFDRWWNRDGVGNEEQADAFWKSLG